MRPHLIIVITNIFYKDDQIAKLIWGGSWEKVPYGSRSDFEKTRVKFGQDVKIMLTKCYRNNRNSVINPDISKRFSMAYFWNPGVIEVSPWNQSWNNEIGVTEIRTANPSSEIVDLPTTCRPRRTCNSSLQGKHWIFDENYFLRSSNSQTNSLVKAWENFRSEVGIKCHQSCLVALVLCTKSYIHT